MKQFLQFFIVLLTIMPVQAQKLKLINRTTGDVIENVAAYNQGRDRSTISDENGELNLSVFRVGDSIYFQHPSYVNKAITYSKALTLSTIKFDKKVILIPEFVVTASKYKERKTDISQMIDIVSADELKYSSSQNSADILNETGNIFIQKSQGGGGSPILRGFEANKVLLVIDGIRMNNSIYRSGHLQNSITIDNAILDRVEVVYGPSSVIYGSDALGGTIHYLTKSPKYSDNKLKAGFNAYTQIATANNSEKLHADFSLSDKRFAMLTSVTLSSFGDIRMGGNRSPLLEDFGKCQHYVKRENERDTMLVNDNPFVQKYTGYNQYDFLQKLKFKISERNELELNIQHSTSSNIHRYDNLNDYTSDSLLKYAEWYYGPQDRWLVSLKNTFKPNRKYFTEITTIVAYQAIEESRHNRKFQNDFRTSQIENLSILSGNLDFLKEFADKSFLHYGIDIQFDKLKSEGYMSNILTGERGFALSRYPDNGSIYWNNSVFAAFKKPVKKKLIVSAGARYNYSYTEFMYKTEHNLLDTTFYIRSNNAITGTLGLVYKKSPYTRFNLNLATGYRNPNMDDLSKFRPKGNDVLLPNPYLDPEYTYNAEIGFSKTFDGYIQLSGYYYVTHLTKAIVREKSTARNGADTIFYGDEYYDIYRNSNTNEAIIHGFSLNLISDLNSNVSFKGTFNYTEGKNISTNGPMAHIPPINGRAEVKYKMRKLVYDIYLIYNGWKRIDDMAATGEDNEDEGTEYGFSGWYTLNTRLSYAVNNKIDFQVSLENITDNFYKPFASGVAAPGFNFIATLRLEI